MRNKLAIIAVLLLVLMNTWKWWPEKSDNQKNHSNDNEMITHVDLVLPDTIYGINISGKTNRDIFHYKSDVSNIVPVKMKKVDNSRNKDEKNITGNLKRINKRPITAPLKLVGVLIKDEQRHAFIMSGDIKQSLSEGDVFENLYKVATINELSVTLYNLKTNNTIELNL